MAESSGEGDKEVGSDQGQGQQDLSSVPFPEDCGAKRAAGQANSKEEDLGTGRPQKNLQHYSWARGSYNSRACGREGLPVSIILVEVSVCDIPSRQALKGISATIKPNCRVLMKIMYLYVVLSIYETLNPNMSPKQGFELPLPWKRHFSAKAGHFLCEDAGFKKCPKNIIFGLEHKEKNNL